MLLTIGSFEDCNHRELFWHICGLILGDGTHADVETVSRSLDEACIELPDGVLPYLGHLIATVPTAGQISHYAKVIADAEAERERASDTDHATT